ncbi:MAG: LysM peptidoglycan-binding domain-containing protein, partial [Ornithinimicrobium sp.]|uniref:LysM peptidoglycan-binding domain-containing protein n=1 Tax=Ornithinimicrobium sp. TaxID=1977084 RepID=UPI0026E04CF3
MSPLFVALPPADLPAVAYQPPGLHTVELLAAKTTGAHTIRSGDTVYGIAARYGVSPQAIVRANGLKDGGRWIMPGDVLTIPGKGASSADAAPQQTSTPSKVSPSSSAGSITVRAG